MAKINPFKGIRPKEGLESRIAALPYDVYNREEAKEEVAREPLSFLKIDRAEVSFPDDVDTYDDRVYKGAHDLLWKLINKGYFIQEKNHCYYIYELTMNGRTQTGIVACASIDDYENQIIKKYPRVTNFVGIQNVLYSILFIHDLITISTSSSRLTCSYCYGYHWLRLAYWYL